MLLMKPQVFSMMVHTKVKVLVVQLDIPLAVPLDHIQEVDLELQEVHHTQAPLAFQDLDQLHQDHKAQQEVLELQAIPVDQADILLVPQALQASLELQDHHLEDLVFLEFLARLPVDLASLE